jgi:hypothetical protein
LLCGALSVCYARRPDSCAADTFLPAWAWAAPGLGLAALGLSRRRIRFFASDVALWLLFLALFADESRGLMRPGGWPSPGSRSARQRGAIVRVISLNCAGGSKEAAAEVVPFHPDIVLLQETPALEGVEALSRRLFGKQAAVGRGVDTDVIARGRVSPKPRVGKPPFAFLQASVHLTSGINVEVFSVHFMPPVLRFDVWSPSCWQEQAQDRRFHRSQAMQIAQAVRSLPVTRPIIVGGDFNVPGGDGAVGIFRPRLHDTFVEGGRGWGDTAINDTPVSRFDQIWASRQFRAVSVVARKTKHSDHRMVICDLVVSGR